MLTFRAHPTGRPVWVDPFKVGAITDAIEISEPTIQGAPPTMKVVGTTLVVDGSSVMLGDDPKIVAAAIIKYRKEFGLKAN